MTTLLTITEAAARLGLKSKDAVYRRIASGALEAVDISQPGERPKTRIADTAIEAYIEACARPLRRSA